MPLKNRISIVGAGPVGCLLALQFMKRGYSVDLFERRPDIRKSEISAGRSINLALSLRGIHALATMGIEKKILAKAIPMMGRMIHDLKGACTFQRYGMSDDQYINSISRAELNRALLNAADSEENCKIYFEHRLTSYDIAKAQLNFHLENENQDISMHSSCVLGSDGSASALRASLVEQCGAKVQEDLLSYGYKELTIPAGPEGAFLMEKHALHIWPRGKFMLIALPNADGSFTCTLFLPLEGEESFQNFDETPQGRAAIGRFFETYFRDAQKLIPDLEEAMLHNPTGKMVTVKSDKWFHKGQVLLVGDAAHAIVPFFGQGLNCSFEDCVLLDASFDSEAKLERVFKDFAQKRKPDADAIAQLALDNFVEMRDKVGQSRFLLEKEIEKKLMTNFPADYVSRYSLVTFSRRPYRHALIAGQAQDKILKQLSEGITSVEDMNLDLAQTLIAQYRKELNPL